MKKFAALLFILSSTYSFSQEKILDSIYNFKLTNTDIIWQKIYNLNDTITVNKTKEQLQTDEFTNNLNKVNGNLSGRSNNHGKRLVKNSPYYATWGFDTYLKIEFKEKNSEPPQTILYLEVLYLIFTAFKNNKITHCL